MKNSGNKTRKYRKKTVAQASARRNNSNLSSRGKNVRAILITAFLLFAALIFLTVEFTPIPQVGDYPSVEDQNNLMAAFLRTTVQHQRAKSNNQEFFTIKLSPDELNSLLMTALTVFKSQSSEKDPMLYGKWHADKLHAELSYKQSGVYFTLRCIAQVSLDNRNLRVSISDSTLGMLPVPSLVIEEYANQEIAKLISQPEMQGFFDVVKSFSFDSEGNAILVVNSQRAPELLFSLF